MFFCLDYSFTAVESLMAMPTWEAVALPRQGPIGETVILPGGSLTPTVNLTGTLDQSES